MIARSLLLLAALLFTATPSFAEEVKPDDTVSLNLSAENWVTTQTARVVVNVEAAVSGSTAGATRADMQKAVEAIVKNTEPRLINFSRSTDQTGMERWSAQYEARLPENQLSGLGEAAKKQSKAGLQLSIIAIDFSPTLAEIESATSQLRAQIYKNALEQLTALNSIMTGRTYRIATIDFAHTGNMPRPMMAPARNLMMAKGAAMAESFASDASAPSMERAEKLTLSAQVVFASTPTEPKAPAAKESKD